MPPKSKPKLPSVAPGSAIASVNRHPHLSAREARLAAGFTLQHVGARLRRTPAYIGQCERKRDFPLVLAEKLCRLYDCDLNVFRPGAGNQISTRRGNAPRRKRAGAGVRRSAPAPRAGA